jgi:Uma2 family endonuclease
MVKAMATRTRLTADDLWRMGEGDVRRELVDGEVIEMTPAGGVLGEVVAKLCRRLADHVEAHRLGKVVAGDVGFVLALPSDPERVRAPDVAFLSTRRLPEGRLPQGFIAGAPDLAVEVLSPSENPVEVQQKVRDYLEAGARLVWIVAPRARTATIYRPDGSARLVREPDSLDGEAIVPGLAIPLADVLE